ncbi:MAG TPA: ATP-binding protein [Blastocatellia bacterium]|nr:ATP-binding protein [Blastocatellia bacterium]
MNSLKGKLALSYTLLIVIILAVSGWAIYHLVHLGRSVDVILVNNYKSILAAENMKEALERIDSSAMFFVASHTEKARRQFAENGEKFEEEFNVAADNITEPGEDQIVREIDTRYAAYKKQIDRFLNNPRGFSAAEQSKIYFESLEPAFLGIKGRLDDLLHLNQQAMVSASERAQAQSLRAEVSTAIVAALGFVLAFGFAWRFTTYVVDPISLLSEKAKRIGEGDFDQHIEVSSKDEIGMLANEFNRMLVRLRDLRKSDYGRLLVEQKKSDAVIDSLGEPVIVTDSRDHVIKINRAARELFEGSRSADGEVNLEHVAGGESVLRAVHEAVSMQRPVATEGEKAMVPIRIDGAQRNFRVRATPMRDSEGRMLGAVTLLEDITAITELDRLKTEFVSVASSKLSEPLNALRLALHAVSEGYVGELNDDQKEMVALARDNADKLDELMSDLLELAEIDSGARRLSLERLRPIDLARDAVGRFRAAADDKQIKLENTVWPDLSWVFADRRATAHILDNLLSNALRHTDRHGTITIDATEHVGRVYISVKDTGEGIPEQQLPQIFDRFSRIGARPGGTGLGLALVKRLVEAQGGQVSVESREGEGSTFTFALITGGPASVRQTA